MVKLFRFLKKYINLILISACLLFSCAALAYDDGGTDNGHHSRNDDGNNSGYNNDRGDRGGNSQDDDSGYGSQPSSGVSGEDAEQARQLLRQLFNNADYKHFKKYPEPKLFDIPRRSGQ